MYFREVTHRGDAAFFMNATAGRPGMKPGTKPGTKPGMKPGMKWSGSEGVAGPRTLVMPPMSHAGTLENPGQSLCRRVLPLDHHASSCADWT